MTPGPPPGLAETAAGEADGRRRALILSLCPLSVMGGGETYVFNACLSGERAGYAIDLVSPVRLPPPQSPFSSRRRLALIRVRDSTSLHGDALTWEDLLGQMAQYDLVCLHQFLASDLVFDVIAAVDSTRALTLTSHGYEPLLDVFAGFYQPARHHFVVSDSAFAAVRMRERGIPSTHLYAGIWREDILTPAGRRSGAAGRHPHPENRRYCAIGRMLPHKGYEVAIEALRPAEELIHIGPPGSGSYLDDLRSAAAGKRVVFNGFLDEQRKLEWLRSCDALLACSRQRRADGVRVEQAELLGLVVLEAVCAGVLPVTSDVPPFVEIMDALGLGAWVCPEGDASSLRRALDRLGTLEEAEVVSLVAMAQATLAERFAWDDYFERLCAACGARP